MKDEQEKPLWEPTSRELSESHMTRFIAQFNNLGINSYSALYDWSLAHQEDFWIALWKFCEVRGEMDSFSKPLSVFAQDRKFQNSRWFPNGKLNFAENLLWKNDNTDAVIFYGEREGVQRWTFKTLREHVLRIRAYFRQIGINSESTIAAITANTPETIACMLAATSLGATWCSVAPEFGPTGILERFQQISPNVLIASERYFYKGKEILLEEKIRQTAEALSSVTEILVIPYLESTLKIQGTTPYADVQRLQPDTSPFEQFAFNHPVYYLFTSGTTGKPKGIIHGAGGTLLEHKKELMLHTDLKEGDTIFYQTTCAWMMWNWLVSGLSVGATVTLYDGFPLEDDGSLLLEMAEKESVSVFGTNPGYLREVASRDLLKHRTFNLSALKSVLSTGAPLLPSQFKWFYKTFPKHIRLSSISGGTDIVGCFALGNPLLPVLSGQLQCRSLGYHVEAFDEKGNAVIEERGELVCTKPFMSMPVGFVGDSEGARYESAYFTVFPDVWHHGDAITITKQGGVIVHERSDDILNASGVRIGPAEIYRQALALEGVQEACAVTMNVRNEDRIVLFLILSPEMIWNDEKEKKLCHKLRSEESPRHVPWKIVIADDFPRTLSGKTSASAIRNILQGKTVLNKHALKNPEVLGFYESQRENLLTSS